MVAIWFRALEAGGASVAPLGPAEEVLFLGLNLVGHALRVGGASVALLSTATAPQLVLDLTPNGHGPRLVDHFILFLLEFPSIANQWNMVLWSANLTIERTKGWY